MTTTRTPERPVRAAQEPRSLIHDWLSRAIRLYRSYRARRAARHALNANPR